MTKKLMMMVAALVAAVGVWADTETVGGYTWTYQINGDTAEICNGYSAAISPKPTGTVTIPSTLGGKPVTSIGDYAFYDCSGLTSVTIPDSVTSIGSSAFSGCSGLTSMTIPNNVANIGWAAFYGCSGLTSVTIPNSVTSIGEYAFYGCSGLTSVTIGNGVTSIGEYAFNVCSGLMSFAVSSANAKYKSVNGLLLSKDGKTLVHGINGDVTIPDGVTSIESYAFSGCSGLTSVTIPNGVTSIGRSAFFGCSGLTSVTIPDSVTNIGSSAFAYCSGLTSVTIPDSVMNIDSPAFYGCSSFVLISVDSANPVYKSVNGLLLTKDGEILIQGVNGAVTIPDSVTSIGNSAFSGCSGLTSITIPDSVTNIGGRAFDGCSSLVSISVDSANPVYKSVNGLLLTKDGETLIQGVNGAVTIPDGVKSIGSSVFSVSHGVVFGTLHGAFSDCSGLTSVTIPDSVTDIGPWAFSDCSGLTSVTIPDSVTDIGPWAFSDCSGLTSVMIPDSVTNIGYGAFYQCSGLMSVTIPDSITNLAEHAFSGCWNLQSVVFQGDCPQIAPSNIYESSYYVKTYVSHYANGWDEALVAGTWNGRPIMLLDLADDEPQFDCIENPDGTISLNEYKGRSVDEIYIPASIGGRTVSAIGSHAFQTCARLKSITIPDTVTWIGDEAFAGCSSLLSVTYLGNAPDVGRNIYKGTPRTLVSYVTGGTIGWSGGISTVVPEIWNDRGITCEWIVNFNAQGGVSGETTRVVTDGCAVGELPVATRDGYTFDGWHTAAVGGEIVSAKTIVTADATYYAHWTEIVEPEPEPEPEPGSQPEPVARPYLYETVEGAVPGLASVYDGCLCSTNLGGSFMGTIQIKVGKPNKNTGLASVKATVVIGGARKTLKAVENGKARIASDGPTMVSFAGGEPCKIMLGANGISGYYGHYWIFESARNLFASKDKSEQSAANNLLEPWLGAFAAVWDGGSVSVSIAKKGKVKAAVTLADGTKATANAQLLVGEEWLCVPVVVTKKTNLAFALWLPRDGGEAVVEGLPGDAIVGRAGALKAGAKFSVSNTAALWEQIGVLTDYLPDEVPITLNKTKWMLPKAGKVAYLRGTALIDESKLGENPSGLKLSYKAKDGSFKGSFKAYVEVNGKLKAKTVSVSGVVVGGKGYGSATIKKAGSVAVAIE